MDVQCQENESGGHLGEPVEQEMSGAIERNSRFKVSGEILRDKVVVKGKTEIDGLGHPTPDMDKVQTVGVGVHQYCIGSDVKQARGELSLVFNWHRTEDAEHLADMCMYAHQSDYASLC